MTLLNQRHCFSTIYFLIRKSVFLLFLFEIELYITYIKCVFLFFSENFCFTYIIYLVFILIYLFYIHFVSIAVRDVYKCTGYIYYIYVYIIPVKLDASYRCLNFVNLGTQIQHLTKKHAQIQLFNLFFIRLWVINFSW